LAELEGRNGRNGLRTRCWEMNGCREEDRETVGKESRGIGNWRREKTHYFLKRSVLLPCTLPRFLRRPEKGSQVQRETTIKEGGRQDPSRLQQPGSTKLRAYPSPGHQDGRMQMWPLRSQPGPLIWEKERKAVIF